MVLDTKLRRYGPATISCGLAFAVAWPFDAFASPMRLQNLPALVATPTSP